MLNINYFVFHCIVYYDVTIRRWNNFEEETPEWMNDDDEGEEDLAC